MMWSIVFIRKLYIKELVELIYVFNLNLLMDELNVSRDSNRSNQSIETLEED